jgi:hypothetical protein
MKSYIFAIGVVAAAFALAAALPSAFAAGAIAPDGSNWGDATADFAPLGDHASSFGGDRSGLGNLAQAFGSWCGLLAFLGFSC